MLSRIMVLPVLYWCEATCLTVKEGIYPVIIPTTPVLAAVNGTKFLSSYDTESETNPTSNLSPSRDERLT
jgi:hypothetical protein